VCVCVCVVEREEDAVLVEQVESDAVLPPLHHVVVEGGRVPAVVALSLIGLFPRSRAPDWLPQAVARRGAGAAVVARGVVVGVGGGGVDALVVSVRAQQVVVEEEVGVMGQVLRLQVMEGRGGGQRRGHERRRERGDGRHGAGGGFWVAVGEVVVVVLGEVVSRLHVRVVHDLLLAVLRLVVEDGGQVGDGRRVGRQGPGGGHR